MNRGTSTKFELVIIVLLVCCIVSPVFSYRFTKPPTLTNLTDKNQLNALNEVLENLWTVTNGRYTTATTTTLPTINASEGDSRLFNNVSHQRIYYYINSSWKYANLS